MSFVRPEVARSLTRWREALIGAAAFGLGAWLAATSYGVLFLFGCALTALGAALVFTGLRRARRPGDGGGPGVVDIDERRITYFHAMSGAAISADELVSVRIRRGLPGRPNGFLWLLSDEGGQSLAIPSDAEGAAGIFDVLYGLPGFAIDDAFDAGADPSREPFTIWERPAPRLH